MDFALKILQLINYPRINIANNEYQFYKQYPNLQAINPEFRRSKLLSFAFIGYFITRPFGFQHIGVFLAPLGYFLYSQVVAYRNKDKFTGEFRSGLRVINVWRGKSEAKVTEGREERKGENGRGYAVKKYDVEKLNLSGIEKMVESLPMEYFKC